MLLRLSKILGFLLLLVVVLVAALLGKAHWQVRQVQTPLPANSEIRSILARPDPPVSITVINTGTQRIPGTGVLSYPAFALRWSDGRILLIDVGMEREAAVEFGRVIERVTDAGPVTPHGSVGEQLGSTTNDVAGVAFTHLHEDHTGGLNSLCVDSGKEISLFQTTLQIDQQNYTTAIGDEVITNAACVRRTRLSTDGLLYTLPGFPGLAAFAAGGHTPGSTVYFAQVKDTLWVLAGDITNAKISITNNVPKSMLYSLLITPEATGRLEELRLWLAELDADETISVLVSHDLQSLQDSPIAIMKGAATR
jgi:glyoxylase-like metal-dependent hydrolase (beta-lactamase superfamily II)